jgi:hypothetical protein
MQHLRRHYLVPWATNKAHAAPALITGASSEDPAATRSILDPPYRQRHVGDDDVMPLAG